MPHGKRMSQFSPQVCLNTFVEIEVKSPTNFFPILFLGVTWSLRIAWIWTRVSAVNAEMATEKCVMCVFLFVPRDVFTVIVSTRINAAVILDLLGATGNFN